MKVDPNRQNKLTKEFIEKESEICHLKSKIDDLKMEQKDILIELRTLIE